MRWNLIGLILLVNLTVIHATHAAIVIFYFTAEQVSVGGPATPTGSPTEAAAANALFSDSFG